MAGDVAGSGPVRQWVRRMGHRSVGPLQTSAAAPKLGVQEWEARLTDHATPNLPSRDFEATSRFYQTLGFVEGWRDDGWMILDRGSIRLEFFLYPDLDPQTSGYGSCLRLDDLEGFFQTGIDAGLPETNSGFPRIHRPERQDWGGTMGALLDPDGSLLRLIQN